jgi:hypothetical protein
VTTTAEANTQRATVAEFINHLDNVIDDARGAGIPDQTIFLELNRAKDRVRARDETWLAAGDRVVQIKDSAIQEEMDRQRDVCPTCGEETL